MTEDQADPSTSAKGARPPPINITLQDPKDTQDTKRHPIALMENSLKIKNFHIKRIHAGKHVLYLQNLNDHAKAKKNTDRSQRGLFHIYPKISKTSHVPAKRARKQLHKSRNSRRPKSPENRRS